MQNILEQRRPLVGDDIVRFAFHTRHAETLRTPQRDDLAELEDSSASVVRNKRLQNHIKKRHYSRIRAGGFPGECLMAVSIPAPLAAPIPSASSS